MKKFFSHFKKLFFKNNIQDDFLNIETHFRLAFDLSPIGMALSNSDVQWIRVNSALCQLLGYSEEELLQMNYKQITYPDDLKVSLKKIQELVEGKIEKIQMEKRYYHRDGHIVWALLNVILIRNSKNEPAYFIAQIQDITKQKQIEDKLHYQVEHDSLTGLVNRNYLERELKKIILKYQKYQKNFVMFFLDFDNFKQINDSFGHEAGDQLLKIIADRLLNNLRKTDIVARIGGDEFILILFDLDDDEKIALFAERIMLILQEPILMLNQEITITTSIGISFFPLDGIDYTSLFKNADKALYKAKEKGRNNYQFYTEEINKKIKEKISFENALHKALADEKFQIYYLPQIDLKTQKITSIEALLRWESKEYGIITPEQIISIAEKTDFIIVLSKWIIHTASSVVKKQFSHKYPSLKLSVNISAKHFLHTHLVESIIEELHQSDFDPNLFCLEINESLIMNDFKTAYKITHDLRKYGIKIIIDNFGAGFLSLPYLHDFAIDAIKIDKLIIQNKMASDKNSALVEAIISLAKNLKLKVFASGIETREQYEMLLRAGCDEAQGYYICNPALANELTKFLKTYQPGKLLNYF